MLTKEYGCHMDFAELQTVAYDSSIAKFLRSLKIDENVIHKM